MALLQMINAVRGKLREERIASISTSDLLTTEIIDLINDAGSEILEGNDWEFDKRHDGRLWYPSSQSGTFATLTENTIIEGETDVRLQLSGDAATGEVFDDVAAIDLAGFRCSGNRMRSRVVLTGATSFANTSWIITSVDLAISTMHLVIQDALKLDATAGDVAWTTYASEVVLPTNVKDVLSVRHEDNPLSLEFVDREMGFDKWVPRATDSYSTTPEVVTIGGTITSTARLDTGPLWTGISAEAAVTGVGAMVWPIPSADIHIQFSYRVQHSDLSTATDTWTGVPDNVIHAIEWKAFQLAQLSGIQPDPEGARGSEREVERRIARALGNQSRQPNRRRVPRTFGGHPHGNPRRRWASQSISV